MIAQPSFVTLLGETRLTVVVPDAIVLRPHDAVPTLLVAILQPQPNQAAQSVPEWTFDPPGTVGSSPRPDQNGRDASQFPDSFSRRRLTAS